jgi:hypothetical protein
LSQCNYWANFRAILPDRSAAINPKIPKADDAYGIILPAAYAAVLDRFRG